MLGTQEMVSGLAFTISFLPGYAHVVRPFSVLSVKAVSSLRELGLEFVKALGSI